jgi:hypothetical protein
MDALAAGHDAAVQMIDTSVVRVHQHGSCIADNNLQDMGRSRGGGDRCDGSHRPPPAANPASCESSPPTKRGGRSLCRPSRLEGITYFRLVIAVRSAESLAMPAAPHQLEPKPPGLIAVTKLALALVVE